MTEHRLQLHERSLLSIDAFRSFFPRKVVRGEPVFITRETVYAWARRGWIKIQHLNSGTPVIPQKYVQRMIKRPTAKGAQN